MTTLTLLGTALIFAVIAIVPALLIVTFADWLDRREALDEYTAGLIPECADVAPDVRAVDEAMLAALNGREEGQ